MAAVEEEDPASGRSGDRDEASDQAVFGTEPGADDKEEHVVGTSSSAS